MRSSALLADDPAQEIQPGVSTTLWEYVQRSGLRSVVLGTSRDPNAKITVLLISSETRMPVLAVKAPTSDIAARAVEREARMLRELDGLPFGTLSPTIPRIVATVEFEGRLAIVTTAVAGAPLTTSYIGWRHTSRRDRVASDFAAVGTWLAGFQATTAGAAAPIEMDCGVVARLRERYPASAALSADIDRLSQIYGRLRRDAAPRTAVHGDLWFGNALFAEGHVSGMVDWEGGATSGEPVRDLARFALMYALFLDRRTRAGRSVDGHPGLQAGTFGCGVEFALDGTGWFPDLFRRFLGDGLARLGASPERWRDAALAGIAEVAAFTDEDTFAERHLELFRRLATIPHKETR
jgi:hypothetical protein